MAAATKELSREEISRRTAILKRFRELLRAQRDRFQAYLDALDRNRETIERGTAEDLIRHVELEEKIVADIYSIQKVIDPMEDMYQAVSRTGGQANGQAGGHDEIIGIKNALADLKKEAISRSERNKNLLSKRMVELRSEIKNLKSNPYSRQRSVYSGSPSPSRVDIRG
ncbi:MAG: flagellar biosynthesis protein FlgN [Treponema sp.]|nr:flagellar biosynthesis protein FlgN [Treponema sp.]